MTDGKRRHRRFKTPMNSKATPARVTALEALHLVRENEAFARDVIDKAIDTSKLGETERAFAVRLAVGVVQYRGTLDFILDHSMRSPDDVQPFERDALAISVYEMYYLGKEPYAAVNEGVELMKGISPKAGGLANAVLRRAAALKPAFPFGDPKKDIEAYSRLHGFPSWIVKNAIQDMGAADAHAFLTASNKPAPLFANINACAEEFDPSLNEEEVLDQLVRAKAAPAEVLLEGERIPGAIQLGTTRAMRDGRVRRYANNGAVVVSDAAAQAVAAKVASLGPFDSMLEIGAGRGTKTVLLQSMAKRMHGQQTPRHIAVDNRGFKTSVLRERAKKAGAQVESAVVCDATDLNKSFDGEKFDCVFIDAPCSGLGTLRRHPEARWRVTEKGLARSAERALNMLKSAAEHVQPGGILAYSTCTVSKKENEDVVSAFLASEEGASFEPVKLSDDEDGYFRTRVDAEGPDAHFLAAFRSINI